MFGNLIKRGNNTSRNRRLVAEYSLIYFGKDSGILWGPYIMSNYSRPYGKARNLTLEILELDVRYGYTNQRVITGLR